MSANTNAVTERMPGVAADASRQGSPVRRLAGWRPRAGAAARHGSWRLDDNRTLRLQPGRDGVVVRCEAGTVVVTFRGDPDDHVLTAGDELTLVGRGLVVVWALSDASVTARPARRARADAPADRAA